MPGDTVGEANFKIGVDATKFNSGLKGAENAAQSASGNIGQSVANTEKATTGAFNRIAQGLLGTVAAFGALTASAYAAFQAGQQISRALRSGAEAAEDFKLALDLSKTQDSIKSTEAQISELNQAVAILSVETESVADAFYQAYARIKFGSLDKIQQELKGLQESYKNLLEQQAQLNKLDVFKRQTEILRERIETLRSLQQQQTASFGFSDAVLGELKYQTDALRDIASRVR